MAKLINESGGPVLIGGTTHAPGDAFDADDAVMSMSGVKAMIDSGDLVEQKGRGKAKAEPSE